MLRFFAVVLLLGGAAALGLGSWILLGMPGLAPQVAATLAPPGIEAAPMEQAAPEPQTSSQPVLGSGSVLQPSFDADSDEPFTIAAADQAFAETLKTVPIAHETPKEALFGRSFEVYVALDGTGDISAADALPGRGNVVESEAHISTSVQAAISGESFDIEALTPLVQRVSPLTENIWRWKVTPREVGPQDLVIELFALDDGEAMPVRTFRDRVEVQVSPIGQVVALAQTVSPVAMVAGGIGSLLAGLLGVLRLFRGES